MNYTEFLETKIKLSQNPGISPDPDSLNPKLFPFQKYVITRALNAGCFAVWADCGLGKTFMQLEWANQVAKHTGKPVLILAPLAVVGQTIAQGKQFDIPVTEPEYGFLTPSTAPVQITNYEQIENIDCSIFGGIALDESSILKNYTGAYRNLIIDTFKNTPFKTAWTATPSPNDELEIGNHAEFLNIMSSMDMRAVYFTTDKEIIKGEKYRLKKHATTEFYKWISSWAIMFSKPSDIGFDDKGYNLPPLNYIEKRIETEVRETNQLFNSVTVSATNFNQ